MKEIVKAMLWKEFRVFCKSTIVLSLFYFGALTAGMYYLLMQLNEMQLLGKEIVSVYFYIYIILMMVLNGGVIASFSTSTDNKEGILNSLISFVRKSSEVWLGQLIFVSWCSFIFSVIGVISLAFVLKFEMGYIVQVDIKIIMLWLIIAPAMGVLYNAINLFLLWVIRHQAFMLIPGMVVPFLIMILLMEYMDDLISWNMNFIWTFIIGIISMGFTYILLKLIDVIPKQNYVSKI